LGGRSIPLDPALSRPLPPYPAPPNAARQFRRIRASPGRARGVSPNRRSNSSSAIPVK
jgi:hypothetical protein